MIILLEWILCIILFFLSIDQFTQASYGSSYHGNLHYELGIIYIVSSIIAFIIAIIHTKIYDEKNVYTRPQRYDWSVWDSSNGNENHQRYKPKSTTVISMSPCIYKSTQDIIKDIIKEYPLNSTMITSIKQHEKPNKPSFFHFGKKDEPKVYNTPKYDIETEQDGVGCEELLDDLDVTPDFCFIDTSQTTLSDAVQNIYHALSMAIMEYIPTDIRNYVYNNILHIEQSIDNINIFYRNSNELDLKPYLLKNAFIAKIRKYLNIQEIGKIKFIEIKEPSFAEYYSKHYEHKGSC